MNSINLIIIITLSLILFVVGILSIAGKSKFLSKDMLEGIKMKKSIIDEKGLDIFAGVGCFFIGFEILALGIVGNLGYNYAFRIISYALCFTIIYIFAGSQRYDITNFDANGKLKIKTKIAICVVSIMIFYIFMICN